LGAFGGESVHLVTVLQLFILTDVDFIAEPGAFTNSTEW